MFRQKRKVEPTIASLLSFGKQVADSYSAKCKDPNEPKYFNFLSSVLEFLHFLTIPKVIIHFCWKICKKIFELPVIWRGKISKWLTSYFDDHLPVVEYDFL